MYLAIVGDLISRLRSDPEYDPAHSEKLAYSTNQTDYWTDNLHNILALSKVV